MDSSRIFGVELPFQESTNDDEHITVTLVEEDGDSSDGDTVTARVVPIPPTSHRKHKTPFMLVNQRKMQKNSLTNEELLDEFDDYFRNLSEAGSCRNRWKKEGENFSCDCLSVLQNDLLRRSISSFALEFSQRRRKDRLWCLIEWYRYGNPRPKNHLAFCLPTDIDIPVPEEILSINYKICKSALMNVCGIGKGIWATVYDCVKKKKSPSHKLEGRPSNNKRNMNSEEIVSLRSHFVQLQQYSEVQATRFVREETGEVTLRDGEDKNVYLPPVMTKRYCYKRYCADNGYKVKTSSSGKTSLEEDPSFEGRRRKKCVAWSAYWDYWKLHHSNVKVNRPSEDICGLCFQFYNCHKYAKQKTNSQLPTAREQETITEVEVNEYDEHGFVVGGNIVTKESEAAEDSEDERAEIDLLKAAEHVKAARAQRRLFNQKVDECRKGLVDGVRIRTLVVDYGQNMEMPWFGGIQPGETYYYSPLSVFNLGIVDCYDDTLYAHIYTEGQGKKGGNNVASLIMKTLKYFGWINDEEVSPSKDDELNIIFDNCPGQNKNNHVIRLVPYLVEMEYFAKVNFIFLIVGHTKNTADRMFNTMKKKYRITNSHTMSHLYSILESDKIKVLQLQDDEMKNYKLYLGHFYRNLPKLEDYHIFSCDRDDPGNSVKKKMMTIKQSNIPNSHTICFSYIKQGFTGRSNFPSGDKGLIHAIAQRKEMIKKMNLEVIPAPGVNPYKQVELYSKYGKLLKKEDREITCPRPSEEIFDLVTEEKNINKKRKDDKKNLQLQLMEQADM